MSFKAFIKDVLIMETAFLYHPEIRNIQHVALSIVAFVHVGMFTRMMQIHIFAFLGICLWGAVDANDDFVPVDLGCLEESGKAYKSYDNPKLSWDEGDYYCRITFTDGHLANINNQAEFDFIDSKDTGDRWIGYYGGPTADSFVWTDSGETSYSNWEENSPNNSLTDNAVRIIDHKFQDFQMTEKAGFICQSNCIEDATTPSQVLSEAVSVLVNE
ncbi:hypothetical protein CAPTEDRAFT_210803 [Capitella teleta]|uniref:C-type lectin domain-containing protein n=1 Tax=Capitella teleta TaxID=283909 RepID=R7U9P3_CAPTE|nr:hypothetical protein CAPTEDRAFT_210803 [Capitella teleta]|eukprot:ELT99820.1 hypothetical protein CAPTEDRAFT_210803 [Capitella teleta]